MSLGWLGMRVGTKVREVFKLEVGQWNLSDGVGDGLLEQEVIDPGLGGRGTSEQGEFQEEKVS